MKARFAIWNARILCTVLLGGMLGAGCTSVPRAEYQRYRRAFDEARTQGENVLADYAAARQLRSNLVMRTALKANPPGSARFLSARLGLTTLEEAAASQPDDIEVRLRAWGVVGSYNEALAAVAAGASGAEIEGSVNGLLGSLQNFPIQAVAGAAAEAVPYARIATELIAMLQKEIEARRFRQGVLRAAQPMQEFLALLRKDAGLFREYRVTLLNQRFIDQEIGIFDRADRFRSVSASHPWAGAAEVNSLVKQVNAHRVLSPGVETFATIADVSTAAAPAQPQHDAEMIELRTLADAIEREAAEARATVTELSAYHELMRQYALLLGELERKHAELAAVAARSTNRLPSLDQLQQVISNVRLAHRIYSETH